MSVAKIVTEIIPYPISTHKKFINIMSKDFERLTVICYAGNYKWYCQCQCGNKIIATSGHLRNGDTQSCGCLHKEQMIKMFTIHGESKSVNNTPEYRAYCLAKSRCVNTTDAAFHYYGGRGIEFRFDSYGSFLTHIGRKPSKKHSLDRINVNGHYESGNIRWATWREQQRNRRNNRAITINGITKLQCEWAILFNTTDKSIDKRRRRKWCDECSVTLPYGKTCSHITSDS